MIRRFRAAALALLMTLPTGPTAALAQRFDDRVRDLFFSGIAGEADDLVEAIALCDAALAANPDHAEALVWHGSGTFYMAGVAMLALAAWQPARDRAHVRLEGWSMLLVPGAFVLTAEAKPLKLSGALPPLSPFWLDHVALHKVTLWPTPAV